MNVVSAILCACTCVCVCVIRDRQRSLQFLSCPDILWLFLQRVQGGATACSAETHAAVRTGVCVTLSKGPASADWAGRDSAATQVQRHGQSTRRKVVRSEQNCDLFMGIWKQQQTAKPPGKTFLNQMTHSWIMRLALVVSSSIQFFLEDVKLSVRVCVCVCLACSQGKYGLDCAQDCPCLNNGTCDRFTGTCSCTAGYYGHACQHSTQTHTQS